MKTNELSGMALDWAVALCEGWQPERVHDDRGEYWWLFRDSRGMNPKHYHPSTHWGIGGRIIEREKTSVIWMQFSDEQYWLASIDVGSPEAPKECEAKGDAPLIAAMRCYVASKLGDEIEIPEGVI